VEDQGAKARALAAWKRHVSHNWSKIEIQEVTADARALKVGDVLQVNARIALGELVPGDVQVEVYYGMMNDKGEIPEGTSTTMHPQGMEDGVYIFDGAISCRSSGRFGYAIRVLPHHKDMVHPYEMGLILWG